MREKQSAPQPPQPPQYEADSTKIVYPAEIDQCEAIEKAKVKTVLCINFMRGRHCPFGAHCAFAHGEVELRPPSEDMVRRKSEKERAKAERLDAEEEQRRLAAAEGGPPPPQYSSAPGHGAQRSGIAARGGRGGRRSQRNAPPPPPVSAVPPPYGAIVADPQLSPSPRNSAVGPAPPPPPPYRKA